MGKTCPCTAEDTPCHQNNSSARASPKRTLIQPASLRRRTIYALGACQGNGRRATQKMQRAKPKQKTSVSKSHIKKPESSVMPAKNRHAPATSTGCPIPRPEKKSGSIPCPSIICCPILQLLTRKWEAENITQSISLKKTAKPIFNTKAGFLPLMCPKQTGNLRCLKRLICRPPINSTVGPMTALVRSCSMYLGSLSKNWALILVWRRRRQKDI